MSGMGSDMMGPVIDILMKWKTDIMSSLKPSFSSMAEGLFGTSFEANIEKGTLEYESEVCDFYVNEETGKLEWEVPE